MKPLCQLYDEQGQPLQGQGGEGLDILKKGLLHGSSHIWIWRKTNIGADVLIQKRAASKKTWPDLYDISAAGHIDLGESPLEAALREIHEEIGIQVQASDLQMFSVHRAYMLTDTGLIENEFRWLYLLQLSPNTKFVIQKGELSALEWRPLKRFLSELVTDPTQFVPQGKLYFDTVTLALKDAAAKSE